MHTELIRPIEIKHDINNNTIEISAEWKPADDCIFIDWIPAENNVVLFLDGKKIVGKKPDIYTVQMVNNHRYPTKIENVGFAGVYFYRLYSKMNELEIEIKKGTYSFGIKSAVRIDMQARNHGKSKNGITQLLIMSDFCFPMNLFKLRFNFRNGNTVLDFSLPEMYFDRKKKKYVSFCYISSHYKKYGNYDLILTNNYLRDYIEINNNT